MYEHRKHPILSRADFTKRVARHVVLAFFALALALGIGMVGHHYLGERTAGCASQCLDDSGRNGACGSSA